MTLEEALRRIEDRATFLRYAADSASHNPLPPNPRALSGFAEACEDIQELVRAALRALGADTADTRV